MAAKRSTKVKPGWENDGPGKLVDDLCITVAQRERYFTNVLLARKLKLTTKIGVLWTRWYEAKVRVETAKKALMDYILGIDSASSK